MIKPVIRELTPFANDKEKRTALKKLERFKRIIIVQLINRTANDLGLGRTHESRESNDNYTVAFKNGNYEDAKAVFDQVRKILIAVPTSDQYNRIELPAPEYEPQRGKWFTTVDMICYRSGKAI